MRDILAGESAADEIDGFEVTLPDTSDVVVPFDFGPVFLEDRFAEFIFLNLPDHRTEPGHLEPELKTTDA